MCSRYYGSVDDPFTGRVSRSMRVKLQNVFAYHTAKAEAEPRCKPTAAELEETRRRHADAFAAIKRIQKLVTGSEEI